MKKLHFWPALVCLLALFSLQSQAQCPSGSIPYTGQYPLVSGNTYCLNSDLAGVVNIQIQNGATLILMPGVELQGAGSIEIFGTLDVRDGAGVVFNGGASIGSTLDVSSLLKLGRFSYFSITGSLSVSDPTASNPSSANTASIQQDNGSVMEICGPYSQQAVSYATVDFTGTTNAYAHFITKATASGAAGAPVASESQIHWLALSDVDLISPGSATYCGPNATEATCTGANWPTGLSQSSCGQASTIADENNDALPAMFKEITATLNEDNGILSVRWTTASEMNMKAFHIEATADGKNFTRLGTVPTKANEGASSQTLQYDFNYDLSAKRLLNISMAFIAILLAALLSSLFYKRKSKLSFGAVAAAFVLLLAIAGCSKKPRSVEVSPENPHAFIRIAVEDINGSFTYSRTLKVIAR
ncbi:hypothetical protein ABDK00_001880 [Niabella insulamsoli]|uniref:hypothetical protein n=1 Tax=Niabella insulamsoli TaxID=3144874 RepID=UPI0031FBAD76